MRTLTSGETQILSLHNRSHHLKVSIYANSQWYDMTDLEGYNWVISFTQNRNVDDPVASAEVVLWKKIYNLNLATFVDGSKLNASGTLIDVPHEIKIETATVGELVQPASGDWNEIFRGYIEEIDWSDDKIRLSCLDKGTNLNQTFIETQIVYGTSGKTTTLEEEIQDILDDNNTGVSLWSPNGTDLGGKIAGSDSTEWYVGEWKQSKQPVMQAIRRLAQMIGYEIRYQWHWDSIDQTGSYKLVISRPERPVAARGSIDVDGNINVGDTFVINSTTFTCVSGTPGADEFNNASGDTATTCGNIAAMLFASNCSEKDNIEAWAFSDTGDHKVMVEWKTPGTAGNSITFTESLTNASMDGSGTLGGKRAGTDGPATPDWTFTNEDYYSIDRCSISRADVRNVVRVTYENDNNERVTINREDSASISKYGRKYMEITEGSDSEIDTSAEASDFAVACLEDLKEPIANLSVKLPYFWPVELGDTLRISSNDDHFDSNQDLAVVSIEDNFSDNEATTTVELRGKPSGGTKRWLELEGRPGVAPGQDLFSDNAPAPTINVGIGTIIVTFDDPRITNTGMKDWAYTECHVSTTSGFTPSSSTIVASGRQTRFEVNGLLPGTTYYVKLISYDEAGNASSVSTQVYETTQKVGPYHEDEDREHGVLLLNGDFGSVTLDSTDNPPDFWRMDHIRATGYLWLTGQPLNNEYFTVNGTQFTAKTSGATGDQFNIGSTIAETCENIVDAVNSGSESGNIYSYVGPNDDTTIFVWKEGGTDGNLITLDESMSNCAKSGTTFSGGTDGEDYGSSGDVYISTTKTESGGRSLWFKNTTTPTQVDVASKKMPIQRSRLYSVSIDWQHDYSTQEDSSGHKFGVVFHWYDSSKEYIGETNITHRSLYDSTIFTSGPNVWFNRTYSGITPPNDASYFEAILRKTPDSEVFNVYVDSIKVKEIEPSCHIGGFGTQSIADASFTSVTLLSLTDEADGYHNYGECWDTTNDEFVAPRLGNYEFKFVGQITTTTKCQIRFRKDTGSGYSTIAESPIFLPASSPGTVYMSFSTGVIHLSKDDKIEVQVWQDSDGYESLVGSSVSLSGKRLS